ncbi:MAG: hypothetical protein HY047_19910 [Acidobacteria bacterium]|nr:hypothetical protein [Acidobacteriota bacterium]
MHVAHLDEAEEFYVGGLRHFVVKLPSESALASVTERVRVAGLRIEDADAGLLIHDPSKNAILLSVM